MTSLRRGGQRDNTAVVGVAEVRDDVVVVRVRVEDFVHEVQAGAVIEHFVVAFFGTGLQPEFEAHL